MICVTVSQESRRMALVDMLNAAMLGADLIEVRLDRFEKDANLAELMTAKKKPVLFSCKRIEDGGQWNGTEEERTMLLRAAVMAKADYVEIESDAADSVRPFPTYKRVLSYTNLESTPKNIASIYADLQSKKPDVIKLTCKASSVEEAWPLIQILNKPPIPTVVVGLGNSGLMLCLLGRKIGAPWATAALEKGMETYSGQITVRELADIYRYRDIGKSTRFVGVTGEGDRPKYLAGLLNVAFAKANSPLRVLPLQVGNLKLFRKIIDAVRLQGILFDDASTEGLHEIATYDATAKAPIGCANALFPSDEGWIGSNVRGEAVANAIDSIIKERGDSEGLKGRSVVLADVGSLTKMMVPSLRKAGAAIIWGGKSKESVAQAAATFGGRQMLYEGIYNTSHEVLIIGRDGNNAQTDEILDEETSLHSGYLKPGMIVVDLLCKGLKPSRFLKDAKSRGCGVISPRTLLIEEACVMAKRLTNQEFSSNELAHSLNEWIGEE